MQGVIAELKCSVHRFCWLLHNDCSNGFKGRAND